MIFASADAEFALPELKVGTIPGGGGTQYLARMLGKHKVLIRMLSARIRHKS